MSTAAGPVLPAGGGMRLPESRAGDWLAARQAVLARQPFSVLLGARLHRLVDGECEMHLPITPQLLQQYGFVHGGVRSSLADNALTYAGAGALAGDIVTVEMKTNDLRPAVGDGLVARAKVAHAGRAQSVSRCEIFVVKAGEEQLCALAQGATAKVLTSS